MRPEDCMDGSEHNSDRLRWLQNDRNLDTNPSEDGEAMPDNINLDTHLLPRSQVTHGRRWFAVYTTCRHEKRIAEHLESRAVPHFLPMYRSRRSWKDGSNVTLDLPLFPGYIFVHIDRSERVRVLEVPGVLWIVGSSGSQPTPLPDFEIETLRSALNPLSAVPYPTLFVGQRVRICRGALNGIEGIIVRQKNSFRLVITLQLIMQSIAVEVDAGDVEPLEPGLFPDAELPGVSLDRSRIRGLAVCES
jgi:transcription antitermination factor NusG